MEGIEGSGKSTLLRGLAEFLIARGVPTVATREPGGTPLGDRLRAAFIEPGAAIDPTAEAFIVNASRAQLTREIIEPALQAGSFVLCDRFATATLAYQGYGRGLDLEMLRTLARIATGGREPDVILLLDVPVGLSRARVAARARAQGAQTDRLEREDKAFHERVREGYLALARADARIVTLDGMQAPPALLEAARAVLEARLAV